MADDVVLPPPAPGNPPASVVDAERARQMLAAKAAGMSWSEVATEFGYSNRQNAIRAVRRHMERHVADGIEQYREVENVKLDGLEAELASIVYDENVPPMVRIRAIAEARQLSGRRARLNGLDAPIKVDLSVGVRAELLDALAELRDLVEGEVLAVADEPAEQ